MWIVSGNKAHQHKGIKSKMATKGPIYLSGDDYEGVFFEFIEQYSQFGGACNWYTFNPIFVEFEDDRSLGGLECTVVVLGIGVRLRWNYASTPMVDHLKQQMKDLGLED